MAAKPDGDHWVSINREKIAEITQLQMRAFITLKTGAKLGNKKSFKIAEDLIIKAHHELMAAAGTKIES